jgi:solute carrier family 25, member 33/36
MADKKVVVIHSHKSHPSIHFAAGWLGGSIACILLSPLEVIKTRMQSSSGSGGNLSAFQFAKQIAKHEGFVGFYRGLIPHLLGVGPSRAFYFGTYNLIKTYGEDHLGLRGTYLHLGAAAIGSVVSSTVMSPVWVVKTRLKLQSSGGEGNVAYRGMADAFVRVYKEEGVRAFYRGLGASYLGVIETALQFAIYGSLKDAVIEYRIAEEQVAIAARMNAVSGVGNFETAGKQPKRAEFKAYGDSEAFATSAVSKLIAAVLTYPHEVMRTRMREERAENPKYKSVLQTFKLILREEGLKGLYGGLGVHMVRTVPNAAILLMVVEKIVGGEV